MINELIEQFVYELKKETLYVEYVEALNQLNQHRTLLMDYKATKEEYIKMRPYFKYQDFSELKKRFLELSNIVENLEAFHRYQTASSLLKSRLDGLTMSIFDGIFMETKESICELSLENTKEEI